MGALEVPPIIQDMPQGHTQSPPALPSGNVYVFLTSLMLKTVLGSTSPSVAVISAWSTEERKNKARRSLPLLPSSFTLNFPHLKNKGLELL